MEIEYYKLCCSALEKRANELFEVFEKKQLFDFLTLSGLYNFIDEFAIKNYITLDQLTHEIYYGSIGGMRGEEIKDIADDFERSIFAVYIPPKPTDLIIDVRLEDDPKAEHDGDRKYILVYTPKVEIKPVLDLVILKDKNGFL